MNAAPPRRSLPRIRVLFDATYAHRLDGTGRYTRETLRCLRNDPDLAVFALRSRRIQRLPATPRKMVNGLLHVLFSQVWLPLMAFIRKAHIVHTMAVAPWFCQRPVVVTVHDALDFYPHLRPSRLWSTYVRTIGAIGARRSDAVVTASHASAEDLARHYRLPSAKIHVIPNGFALADVQPIRPAGFDATRYVLFVGDDSARKNLPTAIAAMDRVRNHIPALRLVVTGNARLEVTSERSWIIILGDVSDDELVWLYQNAAATVVPSLHEGFSLPVIESLAFGTPVVASDIPAHREVAGNTASLIDPCDVERFATRLADVVNATTPPPPIQSISWSTSAEKLVELYLRLLKSRLGAAP